MPKQRSTIGFNVYDTIKRDIIFGRLQPAMKLKLMEVKEQYQVSIATLRETLNRLASEGFVVAQEQKGFSVAPVSKEDLVEISNLRILLESHALRESIEKGDADWEANLVASHHKLKLAEEKMLSGEIEVKETWKRCDWEFHFALIQACSSKNLLNLHSIIYDKYLRYQMQILTFRGKPAAKEHKKLMEFALKRDSDSATKVLEAHIRGGLRHTMSEMVE